MRRHTPNGFRAPRRQGQNPADINGRTLSCWGCGGTKHLASDRDAPAPCREHYRQNAGSRKQLTLKHAVHLLQEVVSNLEVNEPIPISDDNQDSPDSPSTEEVMDTSHPSGTTNMADTIDSQIASNQIHAYMVREFDEQAENFR